MPSTAAMSPARGDWGSWGAGAGAGLPCSSWAMSLGHAPDRHDGPRRDAIALDVHRPWIGPALHGPEEPARRKFVHVGAARLLRRAHDIPAQEIGGEDEDQHAPDAGEFLQHEGHGAPF